MSGGSWVQSPVWPSFLFNMCHLLDLGSVLLLIHTGRCLQCDLVQCCGYEYWWLCYYPSHKSVSCCAQLFMVRAPELQLLHGCCKQYWSCEPHLSYQSCRIAMEINNRRERKYSGTQNRPNVLLFWIDWLGVKRWDNPGFWYSCTSNYTFLAL